VAELPPGYREVSEDDRKKAQVFFGHGDTKAAMGQYDYAIDMYLSGLRFDPDAVEAHKKLREVSLKRKAGGGRALGMMDAMKLKKSSKDDKENLLNAERLLAFDPGNTDYMLTMAQNAQKAGYFDTVLWIGPLLLEAESTNPKPDYNKAVGLRDVFKAIKAWKMASDALRLAARLRPNNIEFAQEAKNLAALETMQGAGYDKGGSFRDQIRDMDAQRKLLDADKEVHDVDVIARQIADAEKEYAADPNESGKATKLAELLAKTEKHDQEVRAIKLMEEWYEKTKQFRFRKLMGQIKIKQFNREGRAKLKGMTDSPEARQEMIEFRKKQAQYELGEFTEWAKAYPTDMAIRFEIGKRQLMLEQFDDAIASFQGARNDPKHRVDAIILLSRAFYEANFLDEAEETLNSLIKDYNNTENPKFKEMNYWHGRVLEKKGSVEEAKKAYRQVFKLDSTYLDTGARIKRLNAPPGGGNP
jgi:tetratricopeptide (TPR) repeat protein